MAIPLYSEPELTIAVLDFEKPMETAMCLASIRENVKVPHKVVYYHNGQNSSYPYDFFKDSTHWSIDLFVQSRKNNGLGIGTRDLISVIHTPYVLYLQNDQQIGLPFTEELFSEIKSKLDHPYEKIRSVSLSGDVCGNSQFSERAHVMKTDFYKEMERNLPLSCHGAGPYHDGIWREGQIQQHYNLAGYKHDTSLSPIIIDRGIFAVRDNSDGSSWCHRADQKKLWMIKAATKEFDTNSPYPKFTKEEWDELQKSHIWAEGQIPKNEIKDSFTAWNIDLAIEKGYIEELRQRKG
jgi:hypothetical protein